jgi:hypothetical protein
MRRIQNNTTHLLDKRHLSIRDLAKDYKIPFHTLSKYHMKTMEDECEWVG